MPRKQLGADLGQASPVTYIAPGDPPFLILHSNNDEIVYPAAVRRSWPGTSAPTACPHELVMVQRRRPRVRHGGRGPTESRHHHAVVDFFVRTLVQHLPAARHRGWTARTLATPGALWKIRCAMDLTFSAEHEAFRAEARAWLAAHVPADPLPSLDTAEGFEAHRAWERTMFEDRWSVVSWPAEYGGRDLGIFEWLVFEEEYYRARAPKRVSQNGIFLLAPTMLEYGTDAQKARYLPPMASGDEIWCQGWSEPDAGSDLAGIRSRAARDTAPATAGSSTARRRGPAAARSPSGASASSAPTPRPSATAA